MEAMYIGAAGEGEDVVALQSIIAPYPKIKILNHSHIADYEFPTLALIERQAAKDPCYIYYSHTKSVSYPADHPAYVGGRTWFDYMEYFNCINYKNAVKVLDFGYDAYGVKIVKRRDSPSKRTHYSGNSWWANGEYIKTLPAVASLDRADRFEAEMWLGENGGVLYSPCQLFVDYMCCTPFDELFKNGHVKTL